MGAKIQAKGRAAPKGLARLRTYAKGREILVLGPSSAGKSKFAQYLRLGTLDPEGLREMTYHLTKSPTFVVHVGPDGSLALNVRRAVDTPGQTGPIQHATLVGERKPHAVVVLLDSTKTVSSTARWMSLFCNHLDTILRRGHHTRRKLREIVVLLNKRDKIGNSKLDELRENVRAELDRYLAVPLGKKRAAAIPILECIAIQTAQGSDLIDNVITYLAQHLA
ncbi:MAG: GTPase domain-containing protein [Phycisphaerales bacterium]|nr:MAG: GTPase domain-containing protein [Phycisphaerales bacterium]